MAITALDQSTNLCCLRACNRFFAMVLGNKIVQYLALARHECLSDPLLDTLHFYGPGSPDRRGICLVAEEKIEMMCPLGNPYSNHLSQSAESEGDSALFVKTYQDCVHFQESHGNHLLNTKRIDSACTISGSEKAYTRSCCLHPHTKAHQ